MKIIEGFKLRTIAGQAMVIGEGLQQVDFNKVIYLNRSAAMLWEWAEGREFSVEDLAARLTEKYDVTEEEALADAREICTLWRENGLIED